jgi:hypothetical protein
MEVRLAFDFQTILIVDRFLELGTTLDPGKPVKADKCAILSDATCMVTQLRAEAQQLKDTNGSLEDKIKELKVRQPYIHCASIHTIFYNPKAYKS